MVTVFWDFRGIILIDYFLKDETITGEYYATLLSRLHKKLRTERPKLTYKKSFFIKAKVHKLGFKRSPHPPYSPDLAPSDFFFVSKPQDPTRGKEIFV